MLHKKSLVELRGIAQALDIPDIFQKDAIQLAQAIELKQEGIAKKEAPVIAPPQYDARLMSKPPARVSDRGMVEELLAPYVARGMHLRIDDERWYISHGKKTDEGTLRMPPRVVLRCAARVMA